MQSCPKKTTGKSGEISLLCRNVYSVCVFRREEAYKKHKVLCGNPTVFQGHEKDVISAFLDIKRLIKVNEPILRLVWAGYFFR